MDSDSLWPAGTGLPRHGYWETFVQECPSQAGRFFCHWARLGTPGVSSPVSFVYDPLSMPCLRVSHCPILLPCITDVSRVEHLNVTAAQGPSYSGPERGFPPHLPCFSGDENTAVSLLALHLCPSLTASQTVCGEGSFKIIFQSIADW